MVYTRGLNRFLVAFGIDFRKGLRAFRALPCFCANVYKYSRFKDPIFPLRYSDLCPCLADRFADAGTAEGHYFFQDLWAARKIFQARPKRHVDIGSRIDGFVAHLLTFMPVTVIDIRPLRSAVPGLTFLQSDATTLHALPNASVESLSSLHVVEHFGLGRYGDPVDPSAPFRVMQAMTRVVQPGGHLYFSVPVGRQRLEFDGHRIFSPAQVIDSLRPLRLVSFAAIDDNGQYREAPSPSDLAEARHSCGLYEFTK